MKTIFKFLWNFILGTTMILVGGITVAVVSVLAAAFSPIVAVILSIIAIRDSKKDIIIAEAAAAPYYIDPEYRNEA